MKPSSHETATDLFWAAVGTEIQRSQEQTGVTPNIMDVIRDVQIPQDVAEEMQRKTEMCVDAVQKKVREEVVPEEVMQRDMDRVKRHREQVEAEKGIMAKVWEKVRNVLVGAPAPVARKRRRGMALACEGLGDRTLLSATPFGVVAGSMGLAAEVGAYEPGASPVILETITEMKTLSMESLPNGVYAKNVWHTFTVDGVELKAFSDDGTIFVENGVMFVLNGGGEYCPLWIGFKDGDVRMVESVDVVYKRMVFGSKPKVHYSMTDEPASSAVTGSGLVEVHAETARIILMNDGNQLGLKSMQIQVVRTVEKVVEEEKKVKGLEKNVAETVQMEEALSLGWGAAESPGWDVSLRASTNHGSLCDSTITASGKYLVAGYADGTVEVWDAEHGKLSLAVNTGIGRAYQLTTDLVKDIVYVSAGVREGSAVIAFDLTTGKQIWQTKTGNFTNRITVSSDGKQVVADVDESGSVIFDAESGARLGASTNDTYGATALAGGRMTFFRSGSQVWLREADGSERKLGTVNGLSPETALSQDGKHIGVGGTGGQIALYDVHSGKETRFQGSNGTVMGLTFVDNGHLVVGYRGGVMELWDINGSMPVMEKSFHAGGSWIGGMDSAKGTLVTRVHEKGAVWNAVHLVDIPRAVQEKSGVKVEVGNSVENVAENVTEAVVFSALGAEEMSVSAPPALVLADMTARIEQSGDGSGRQKVVITTPFDASYLETPFGIRKADHAGGGTVAILERHLGEMMNFDAARRTGQAPKATITVFADEARTVKVMEIVFVGDAGTGAVSISSAVALPVASSVLPKGAEAKTKATMEAVSISGPNITLLVSVPTESGTVRFVGLHDDGVFTRNTVRGGGLTPVTLGINPGNATGDYDIVLTGSDGRDYGRVRVHWDRDGKKLSLTGGFVLSSVPAETSGSLTEELAMIQVLQQNPGIGDKALLAMRQQTMVECLSDLPAPFNQMVPEFEAAFFAAHPEWMDKNMHATAVKNAAGTKFSVTQTYEALMRQRSEEMGILRSAYGAFGSMTGGLLQRASEVLSGIRSGGNERALRDAFAAEVNRAATSLPMVQLSGIGIRMARADQLLEAAKLIWQREWRMLAEQGVAEQRMAVEKERVALLVGSGSWVAGKDGLLVATASSALVSVDPAVHAHNMRVILQSEGAGTVGERLAAYAKAYGLTAEYVAGVAGVSVEIVAAKNTVFDVEIEGVKTEMYKGGTGLSAAEKERLKFGGNMGTLTEVRDTLHLSLEAEKSRSVTFRVDQESMVNFWTNGMSLRNVTLVLSGGSLPKEGYATTHGTGFGDSVSLKLTPGTYTLTVKDGTNYYMQEKKSLDVALEMKIGKFNSANIEGMISIDGSSKVMPVSMRVAEFYPGENGIRNLNYDLSPEDGGVSKLDPSKPVWVVVHGREDREDSGKMNELVKALAESGYQVVTIDWRQAAGENTPKIGGMQGEAWIQAVADWGFRTLKVAGVSGGSLRLGVHSWGSFVGYEIAEHFKSENGFGVDTIIALDSAKDPTLRARYDASQVDFASVSKTSTAFYSSFWGSTNRANTAKHTVEVRSPKESNMPPDLWSEIFDTTQEHGLAITTFANLIRLQKIDPTNDLAGKFTFSSMAVSAFPMMDDTNSWLYVQSHRKTGTSPSDKYIDAIPQKMTSTNPDDGVVDFYVFNSLLNLTSVLH